jgi:hypothetical protein
MHIMIVKKLIGRDEEESTENKEENNFECCPECGLSPLQEVSVREAFLKYTLNSIEAMLGKEATLAITNEAVKTSHEFIKEIKANIIRRKGIMIAQNSSNEE